MNSINCKVRLGVGCTSGMLWYGSPHIHNRSGLNQVLQWHLRFWRAHESSQGGTVFLRHSILKVLTFMKIKERDLFEEMMNLHSSYSALLCRCILRA